MKVPASAFYLNYLGGKRMVKEKEMAFIVYDLERKAYAIGDKENKYSAYNLASISDILLLALKHGIPIYVKNVNSFTIRFDKSKFPRLEANIQ